jgi:hypothetical protein
MLLLVTFISLGAIILAQEPTTLHPITSATDSHTHAPNETHLLHSEKSHHAEDVVHHVHNKRQVTPPTTIALEFHTHAPNETHLQHGAGSHHVDDVQPHVHNKRQVTPPTTPAPDATTEEVQTIGHHTQTPLARALGRDRRQVAHEESTLSTTTTTTVSPPVTDVPFQHQKREVTEETVTTQLPEVTTGIPAVFPLNVTIRQKREETTSSSDLTTPQLPVTTGIPAVFPINVTIRQKREDTTLQPVTQQVNETIRFKREETTENPDLTTTEPPVTTGIPAVFPLNVTIIQKREATTIEPEGTTSHTATTLRRKRQVIPDRPLLGHQGEHHVNQTETAGSRSTRDTIVPKEEPMTDSATTQRTTQLN